MKRKHTTGLILAGLLFSLMLSLTSCDSAGTYWGVDQRYPVGNGHVYYGAYGGDGPHHGYSKKEYKKYRKHQKKLYKQRLKEQKRYEKMRKHHQKKHYKKHHKKHHDD